MQRKEVINNLFKFLDSKIYGSELSSAESVEPQGGYYYKPLK